MLNHCRHCTVTCVCTRLTSLYRRRVNIPHSHFGGSAIRSPDVWFRLGQLTQPERKVMAMPIDYVHSIERPAGRAL